MVIWPNLEPDGMRFMKMPRPTSLGLNFTAPTSLLVYGLSLAPWIPLLAITWAFENAYFGPDEQARFDEIVAEAKGPRHPPRDGED